MQKRQTLLQSVPAAHVFPSSLSGMQHDASLFGPSRQRPLREADEQLVELDPLELVDPLDPLEPVDPLEPLSSSLDEQAAAETAKRKTKADAMRVMFMSPQTRHPNVCRIEIG